MTEVGALFFLVALAILGYWIFLKWYPQKRREKRKQDLETDLLRMVSGRQDVAERLVRLEQRRSPDKPRSWHLEKAIEQLKRDRR